MSSNSRYTHVSENTNCDGSVWFSACLVDWLDPFNVEPLDIREASREAAENATLAELERRNV